MPTWIWSLAVVAGAFGMSSVATPLLARIGVRFGLCDEATADTLKVHDRAIPLTGGLSIFGASAVCGIAALAGLKNWGTPPLPWIYVIAILPLCLGLVDDARWKGAATYRPIVKFSCQLFVSVAAGVALAFAGARFVFVPWMPFALAAGTFYVFGGMNAVNMQDGIDGLAASLSALSFAGFLVLAICEANASAAILAAGALGGTLGFLIHNAPPAKVFMGDNGSHFLGFMLAVLALIFTSGSWDLRRLVGPLLVLGLPILDAAWAVGRRVLRRERLFGGDREHWYDLMIRRGLSVRATVGLGALAQAVAVIAGLALVMV